MGDAPKKPPPREVILGFADGKYPFRLTNRMISEVQIKCDAGIGLIYRRVSAGIYEIDDLIEVIRHGLIGAGMEGVRAGELMDHYGESLGGDDLHRLALAILSTFMRGYATEGEGGKKPTAPKAGSTSPKPTEPDS